MQVNAPLDVRANFIIANHKGEKTRMPTEKSPDRNEKQPTTKELEHRLQNVTSENEGETGQIFANALVREIHQRALPASTDDEWKRLTNDLALCLAGLVEDEYLVLSYKRGNYYVQFAAQGQFGMRAEAASNAYIVPAKARLTTDDYVAMGKLSWQVPTDLPMQESGREVLDLTGDLPKLLTEVPVVMADPDGSPNFFVDVPCPVDFGSLSELAVRTFREVYRVRHPGQLQYKAFSRNAAQIRLPTLRLKRDET